MAELRQVGALWRNYGKNGEYFSGRLSQDLPKGQGILILRDNDQTNRAQPQFRIFIAVSEEPRLPSRKPRKRAPRPRKTTKSIAPDIAPACLVDEPDFVAGVIEQNIGVSVRPDVTREAVKNAIEQVRVAFKVEPPTVLTPWDVKKQLLQIMSENQR